MHPTIRVLPPELQSQIAAGEVLERPASAIKELVENSLDAGASNITIEIDGGGQERIMVQDNGRGIPEDEIPLALTRHATSKISRMDDLQSISSFGFRGEALASIASVSHTLLTSVVPGADQGTQTEVTHGRILETRPAAMGQGTRIEVRDLFANVPVRLKFLKKTVTEARRCQEVVAQLALAHPDVSFSLAHNGRTIYAFLAGENLVDRLDRIWPPSLMHGLAGIDYSRKGMTVRGVIGSPQQAQGRGDRIIIYVNDRPVKDKLLLRALRQGYKGTLLSKEYPQAVLFLSIPAKEVDINVHPAKTEVRFLDERTVFSIVQGAVQQGLEVFRELQGPGNSPSAASPQETHLGLPNQEDMQPAGSRPGPKDSELPKFSSIHEAQRLFGSRENTQAQPERDPSPRIEADPAPVHNGTPSPSNDHQTRPCVPPPAPPAHGWTYLGQFNRTYLILNANDDTLILMDQHAAHERILYQAFSSAGNRGEHQRLAIPLEMSLHSAEIEVLDRLWGDLGRLGFTLERSAPRTLLIRSIPVNLETSGATAYLRTVLGEQSKDMDALWTTLACKSAIKAGHVLTYDEAMHLIETWSQCSNNRYCPHGRPILVQWTVSQLEKLFKRKP
ncbi:DNA mismatch repair endonuclease MutL [Desulfoplanes sp.]